MAKTWRIYSPDKRTNPSGKTVWRARVKNTETGHLRRLTGTYRTQGLAMDAAQDWIEHHGRVLPLELTLGGYFERWKTRHPRPSPRTNRSNWQRIDLYVLSAIGELPIRELRRRHMLDLRDGLIDQGLGPKMVRNILASLSSMLSDAVDDEAAEANPLYRLKVDARDPRFGGREQRKPRVLTYDQMLELAAAAPHPYGGSVLFAGVTGARPAEVFPRLHSDLDRDNMRVLINSTAYDGKVEEGTKTDHGEEIPGRWSLLTSELLDYIDGAPRSFAGLLWPTPKGKIWWPSNWYRDVFKDARDRVGLSDVTPYDLRHSFVSLMHEAGVPDAEVAACTGHKRVSTMRGIYTHPVGRSVDRMRAVLKRQAE
jgi:integrase